MAKNKSQYDSTLNLPKTLFEMRAGLPKKEPVMLEDWEKNDLYNNLIKHNDGKPKFVLHDGPPYANGNIHMGTALNKIIKDIIIRDKNMEGFQAPYVPGFDTHGLPIELKALSSLGEKKKDISKLELRQICEKFATEHIDIMSDQFKRLGVIGDFEHPYLTLKPEFEARQIEIFGEMAKKGYIYKGLKPVYWCPDCRTALAEAEIEYGEDECDSIFVRFHFSQDPNGVLAKHGIPMEKTYFVIWTTTTWTLPANEAICLNGQFEYSFVKIGDEFHIMATDLCQSGAAVGAPVDRLQALVDVALLGHLAEDLDLTCLKLGLEGQVGMLKVADDAQTLELVAHDVDVLGDKLLADLAQLELGDVLLLLADGGQGLQLNGQAVGIKAGHIGSPSCWRIGRRTTCTTI